MLKTLRRILKTHPEAKDADVWAESNEHSSFQISYLGFDKRYKHYRIKLEE